MAKKTTKEIKVSSSNTTTQLEFYGGVGSIGGNKIALIAGNDKGVLLDFGYSFKIASDYLDDFMKLRNHSILNDAFKLGELPVSKGNLAGLYFEDIYNHEALNISEEFGAIGGQPTHIRDLLISHAHVDHIGNISNLHESIRLICSKMTYEMLKFLEETQSGNSNLTGIINYTPMYRTHISTRKPYVGNEVRENPDPIPRKITTIDSESHDYCAEKGFQVSLFEVDHSIAGASAYILEDQITNCKIGYTGDIRQHGPMAHATAKFIQHAKKAQLDVLITEGTRVHREESNYKESEEEVQNELIKTFQNIQSIDADKPIFFDCSIRDIWRLQTLYQVTQAINRVLIVMPKAYELIKRSINWGIIDGIDLERIKAYLPKKSWGLYTNRDYSQSPEMKYVFPNENSDDLVDFEKPWKIIAPQISEHPGNYVFMLPFYSMTELLDINPPHRSYYISSKSESFDDEGDVEERKRDNWLNLFDIPDENFYQIHCSGHASSEHLEAMLREISPRYLFPVHTEYPEAFKNMNLPETTIISPEKGKTYDLLHL
jgi:ribonuclease J